LFPLFCPFHIYPTFCALPLNCQIQSLPRLFIYLSRIYINIVKWSSMTHHNNHKQNSLNKNTKLMFVQGTLCTY
jgi:hypothetical protein